MSDDGADFGITADRALKTVLGGEPSPEKEEGMSPEEMERFLHDAPDNPETYDDGARAAGKIVLEYLRLHPEDARLPAEAKHEWPNGWDAPSVEVAPGIYDNLKRKEPGAGEKLASLDLTGFMWGWAVNAAKYALDLPPVPNPAIVTVGRRDATDRG